MTGESRAAWLAAHGVDRRWLGAVAACWGSLAVFAAISVPLKYPLAAYGAAVDSGAIAGLLVPLVVTGLVLDEGLRDLVACASRDLWWGRSALAAVYLTVAATGPALVAIAAGLPVGLLIVDGVAAGALVGLGTAWLGTRRGWVPVCVVAAVASTPGLVPWSSNVVYHREVGAAFAGVAGLLVVASLASYGAWGSVGPEFGSLRRRLRSAILRA